jgi:hypothetical protein
MSSPELAQLEMLAQVDQLVDRLRGWVEPEPDWEPLQHCRALVRRLLSRVETLRIRLEAPLIVATFGGTGTGKSALVNARVGRECTLSGRQRPTTTRPILVAHPQTELELLGLPLDEFEIAAALLQEDVELVKCRTVDLEVPAWAEIVLEGEIPPKIREPEGPFSEFQDYYLTGSGQNPIVNIKAITMRNDAIFKNVQNGTEVEGCVYHKVPMSAQILRRARSVGGLADVRNVLVMPGIFGVVVQMKPRYYGEVKNVLMSVLSSEYQHPKIAIAVDIDVDIFNYAEVLWSINTRVNPAEDIVTIPGAKIHAMDPSCPEFGHPGAPGWHRVGGKMIIDATKPPECDGARRNEFERLRPVGWETVNLEDFLPAGAPPLRIKPKIPMD